ncbi:hypothetical protein X975_06885, partial [Stegodyphus mimosarum]
MIVFDKMLKQLSTFLCLYFIYFYQIFTHLQLKYLPFFLHFFCNLSRRYFSSNQPSFF